MKVKGEMGRCAPVATLDVHNLHTEATAAQLHHDSQLGMAPRRLVVPPTVAESYREEGKLISIR